MKTPLIIKQLFKLAVANIIIGFVAGIAGLSIAFVILIAFVLYALLGLNTWLNSDYVSQKNLAAAQDRAIRKTLPTIGAWLERDGWPEQVVGNIATDDLPGERNGCITDYLCDRHDAEQMEVMLNARIWPKECRCPRVDRRPWDHVHTKACIDLKAWTSDTDEDIQPNYERESLRDRLVFETYKKNHSC